jgi:hypothetical protein
MQFLKGLTRFFHFEQEPETTRKPEQAITRRGLLMGLGASLVVAAVPEIPFGRVWSIPKKIVYPPGTLTPEILRKFSEQVLARMGHIQPVMFMHPIQYERLKELVGDGSLGRGPSTISEMIGGVPVVASNFVDEDRIYKLDRGIWRNALTEPLPPMYASRPT